MRLEGLHTSYIYENNVGIILAHKTGAIHTSSQNGTWMKFLVYQIIKLHYRFFFEYPTYCRTYLNTIQYIQYK